MPWLDESFFHRFGDGAVLAVKSKVVEAIIALGKAMELEVVAEGVETKEQLAVLRNLGCDAFQGYLVSEPVPGSVFASLLKKPAKTAS